MCFFASASKLGFERIDFNEFGREAFEEAADFLERVLVEGADDLRQLAEFAEAVALRDAFGTEGDLNLQTLVGDVLLDVLRDAGEDGASEDKRLHIAQVLHTAVKGPVNGGERRVERFVHGRADD